MGLEHRRPRELCVLMEICLVISTLVACGQMWPIMNLKCGYVTKELIFNSVLSLNSHV